MENVLSFVGNKEGFNLAVRHCKKVVEYLGYLGKSANLADIINQSLDNGDITRDQVNPIIGTLIVDKYGYNYKSFNLIRRVEDFSDIVKETEKWTNIDIILFYFHPKLKESLINPKIQSHWDKIGDMTKDEIVVIYAKAGSDADNKTVSEKAINALIDMLQTGEIKKTDSDFISKTQTTATQPVQPVAAPKTVQPSATPAGGAGRKKTMSGKVSVQVSNELFHNGNVEAWKNIIESYYSKYPDLEVVVFYDNEIINNLNALFKWGKVKMGNVILFQVIGYELKDVAKLKRYLYEGASSRFEKFLDKDVNKVLNLF